jgi:hypothetical protein
VSSIRLPSALRLGLEERLIEVSRTGMKRIEYGSTWLTAGGFDHLDKLGAGEAHHGRVRQSSPQADRGRRRSQNGFELIVREVTVAENLVE